VRARAIRFHATGGPEVLIAEEIELPEPGPSEVRLRQTAIGLNFIDVYHRTGLYPVPALPCTPGLEGAGVVEALGASVRELAIGDRVAYASRPLGAYASRRNFPADRLVKLPPSVSDEDAAALMLKGMTAQYLLRRTFRVERGHAILVHAAAGGVGSLLCQWGRALGALVIGSVGSDEKAELARGFGCAHPIVVPREDLVRSVREITAQRGVQVVYDSIGKESFFASLDCLAPRGMLVSFGQSSGLPPPLELGELSRRGSLFLTRPSLFDYTASHEELRATAADLFQAVSSGAVRPWIGQRWPLEQAAEAHRALEGRRTRGATLLVVR
jgi:NADPH2:quinone reductase